MKYGFLLVIISLLTTSIFFAQKRASQDVLLVSSLKNYEIDAHVTFQKELYLSSDTFIQSQSEKFVDNETGFFKLWSEVFSFFESDIKRDARWKSRVEKYFRATEYASYIKEKQSSYSKTINTQRQELLGKLHLRGKQLTISSKDVSAVSISNAKMAKVVEKVNNLVLIEVIPEVIELLVIPILVSFLAFLIGLFFAGKTKGISIILSGAALIFSIWQSIKYSNELESQINESFALKEKKHLTILPELQQNTAIYYQELITKIQE